MEEREMLPFISDSETEGLRRLDSMGSDVSMVSEADDVPDRQALGPTLMRVYRLYMTYFFLTSALVLFLFGLNCLLVTLYTVFLPATRDGAYASSFVTTFSFSLLQSYLWGGILSANVSCIRDFWRNDMRESRENLGRFVLRLRELVARGSRLDAPTSSDTRRYLVYLHLLLVFVVPLAVALVRFAGDERHRLHLLYSTHLFVATFAAMFVVLLRLCAIWWGGARSKVRILTAFRAHRRPWAEFAESVHRLEAFGLDYASVLHTASVLALLMALAAAFFGAYLGEWGSGVALAAGGAGCAAIAAAALACHRATRHERGQVTPQKALSPRARNAFLLTVVLAYLAWFLGSLGSAFVTHWAAGLLFLALWLLTQGLFTRKRSKPVVNHLEQVVGAKNRNIMLSTFVAVYLAVSVLLILFGFSITAPPTPEKGHAILHPSPMAPLLEDRYPICDFRWINDSYTVIDFALLSQLAYVDYNSTQFVAEFGTWGFNATGRLEVLAARSSKTGVTFFDFYDRRNDASIIAIKGTEGGFDVLQDAEIWADPAVFQFSQALGPFVSIWPAPLTESFINASASIKSLFSRSFSDEFNVNYAKELRDYVAEAKPKRKQIVLTGHSLGGGLAKLVGSRTKVATVTFSAPGTMWVRAKEGLSTRDVNTHGFSIVPMTDVVPKVDKLGGLVQFIECSLSYVSCHYISNTICELLRTCGDPIPGTGDYGNRMFLNCDLERGCVGC